MGLVVFQPYQGDSVPARRKGLLQVGERLLETTLINDTFTSLVLPEAGTPACSPGKVLETLTQQRIPQDLAPSKFTSPHWPLGSCPYSNNPTSYHCLGWEYAAQAGQSFSLLLKDGDATPQPTQTLGKIAGTSEKHKNSGWETPKNAQVPFPPPLQPRHCSCLPHSLRVGHQPEGAAGTSLHGRALPPPPGMPGVKSGV